MRFLFLACDFPPAFGGIQRLSLGLCQGLARCGHVVQIIASAQPGDDGFDNRAGLDITRVQVKDKLRGALSLGSAARCVLRGDAVDAVVATKWAPEGPAYIRAARGGGPPLILMGHGREFLPEAHRPVRAFVQRSVVRAAAGAVVNSHFTAGQMVAAGMPEHRVHVVHPGIDADEFADTPDLESARLALGWPEGPTLLSIARLVERKGTDTVIEALPALMERVPDAQFVVIGSGPQESCLRELAGRLGVADRVRFLGAVSDEHRLAALRLCTAFVMPSRDIPTEPPEGFGIVYLEANMCGKPVIGARTGGVADAIEDGLNGLLVDPGSPEQVADAAARLLADDRLAARLGEQGRTRTLERFTWEAVAPRFASVTASIAQTDSA